MVVTTDTGADGGSHSDEIEAVYRDVAEARTTGFHLATGRELAARLGYPPAEIERLPAGALESFAGVGYHLDLAALVDGDVVLDLGSGAGTDVFAAARRVGKRGHVVGLETSDAQLSKSRRLREETGLRTASFWRADVRALPVADGVADAVLSNAAVSLVSRPVHVFEEARRVLAPGGRLAVSDIVCERRLPRRIVRDPTLRAACIGGAVSLETYVDAVETAGFTAVTVRENPWYEFASAWARGLAKQYGLRSVSVSARAR